MFKKIGFHIPQLHDLWKILELGPYIIKTGPLTMPILKAQLNINPKIRYKSQAIIVFISDNTMHTKEETQWVREPTSNSETFQPQQRSIFSFFTFGPLTLLFCNVNSETQGSWAEGEIKNWPFGSAAGLQGGANSSSRRQGHWRRSKQALKDVSLSNIA